MRHLFSSDGFDGIQRLAFTPSALIFDFDGTLAPIVQCPDDARVPLQIAVQLQILSRSWPVAVVTGRSVADVRKKLGFTPAYLFGNHGAERADVLTDRHSNQALAAFRVFLSAHAAALAARKIAVEDKGQSLALHYRQSENPEGARAWLHELTQSASDQLLVSDGHMVMNVVLAHAPDKGDALQTILQESGFDNALVVGDDENDESAFVKAPKQAVTVRIGPAGVRSQARFRLCGHHQVGTLLTLLMHLNTAHGSARSPSPRNFFRLRSNLN